MQRAVNRGLSRPRPVFSQAVSDGRTVESLAECFAQLPKKALGNVNSISMDMSSAYLKATRSHIKNADKKIAIDHFHISKLLTEGVNAIRQQELMKFIPSLRKDAYRTRYLWLT
ncbi:MAG: hypothetical protein CENE_03092 [Candidatus Celerinatantimonas neptuna]|nr:MAG: hypothetical protein CENE_03092 [Candidatus Celerinatantimonas neptuna]